MKRWTPICGVAEIPLLGARRVQRERGLPVALFRTAEDHVHALLDRCPHRGGPLSQGIVFGTAVACPLHNWTIEFADGHERLGMFLDADELATLALDLAAPLAGPCRHATA